MHHRGLVGEANNLRKTPSHIACQLKSAILSASSRQIFFHDTHVILTMESCSMHGFRYIYVNGSAILRGLIVIIEGMMSSFLNGKGKTFLTESLR
jgi:hypothetical protein